MGVSIPLRFTFAVEGEVVVDRVLAGLESRASNISPAWPAVVTEFRAIVGRAFATEGASTGAPWKPLAAATQEDRRRQGYPAAHPILQRTARLQRALTTGEGAHVGTGPTSLRYIVGGEAGRIFAFHQSTRPRAKLPRRAPVLLTADDRTAMMHPVRLFLTGRDPNAPRRRAIG
jgi:Phage virion morphogenesis family